MLALISSCRTTSERGTDAAQEPARDSAETIQLFLTEKPTVSYKEIARVSAYKFTVIGIPIKQDEIYENLKRQAVAKGANAIINITEDIASVYGVAVLLQPTIARSDSLQVVENNTNAPQAPSTASGQDIKLFLTEKPTVPYKEIARVSAYKFTVIGIPIKQDEIYENLKRQAVAKGANAIINITEDIASVYGVAVLLQTAPAKQAPSKQKPSKTKTKSRK